MGHLPSKPEISSGLCGSVLEGQWTYLYLTLLEGKMTIRTAACSGESEREVAAGGDVRSLTDAVVGETLKSQVRLGVVACVTLDAVDTSGRSTTTRPLDPRVACRRVAVRPAVQPRRAVAVRRHVRRH